MRVHLAVLIFVTACSGARSSPDDTGAPPPTPATTAAAVDHCPPSSPLMILPCDDPADDDADSSDSTGADRLTLIPGKFTDLPGWADDELAEAVPAFLRSCAKLASLKDGEAIGASPFGGKARDWRRACKAAAKVPAGDHAAAREFFEGEFKVYAAHGKSGAKAKLSGYFVQELNASRTQSKRYQYPILARPADLVEIQLSDFIDDGRGRRIWGRVDPATHKMLPYPTRTEIRNGALGDNYKVLMWADNQVDVLFMGIEGSGKALMDDGSTAWIAFAGKNGRKYRGIGGTLRRAGLLKKGQGTMNGIRKVLEAHADRFQELTGLSDSKVFFKESSRQGAIGTQDVILTPRRSLAVDRAVIAFSTPVFVSTRAPKSATGGSGPWHQLLIAQDTGGAILGPIRGDIYWGDDREAAAIGGRMGGSGRMWLLLPARMKVKTGAQ